MSLHYGLEVARNFPVSCSWPILGIVVLVLVGMYKGIITSLVPAPLLALIARQGWIGRLLCGKGLNAFSLSALQVLGNRFLAESKKEFFMKQLS